MRLRAVLLRSALAVLAQTIIVPDVVSAPAAELEAYREFVRTPRARRLLTLARDAMRGYWGEAAIGADSSETAWPGTPARLYLSLVDPAGTRACVGRALPYDGALSDALRDLAVHALQADTRRPPVRREELDRLRIVIAFAGLGRPVMDPMEIDPGREGLLVSSGEKSVAFLPGEARTVAWALAEARRTGVLEGPLENATYVRFPVVVLAEPRMTIPPDHEENSDER